MTADAATQANVPLAKLNDATRTALGEILPSFATTTNPIDITAALLSNSHLFGDILPVIARDPVADAFLIGIPVAGTGYDVDAFARDAAAFGVATAKPLVIAAPQSLVADKFSAQGLTVFRTETQALRALNQFLSHRELMGRTAPRAFSRRAPTPTSNPRMLNEAQSLELVTGHGVNAVRHRLCRRVEEVADALNELDGPVVMKGCSPDIAHKSEHGLVHFGVATVQAAAQVFVAMQSKLNALNARFDGVIVAEFASGARELMIGAHLDPVFGPVVIVGDGGKYVEALPDFQMLLPPFTAEEVACALRRLRIAPLLAGVRGEPPLDVNAFSEAAVAIGALLLDAAANVVSLDLNPVMVRGRGEGYAVADAVVFIAR
jgi:acetate---CoA ligase (ADP-forming)